MQTYNEGSLWRHVRPYKYGNSHRTANADTRIRGWSTHNLTAPHPSHSNKYLTSNETRPPNETPRPRISTRNPLQQRNATPPNPCRRCGLQFIPENLQVCPAKRVQCNLCKKVGHYSNVCHSAKFLWQSQKITPQQNIPQTRRVRNVRETTNTQFLPNTNQDAQSDKKDEQLDLKNTFFIQEIFDNWNTVNFVKSRSFNTEHQTFTQIIERNVDTSDKTEIDWLADTGSPRSFVSKEEADRILQNCKSSKWKNAKDCSTKYRCSNNLEIPIIWATQMHIKSGHWDATDNEILVVNSNTVKLLGRDVLTNFGFTISQNKGTHINNIQSDTPIQLPIIRKYPHLGTRLGKSKNHIAKSTIKQDIQP